MAENPPVPVAPLPLAMNRHPARPAAAGFVRIKPARKGLMRLRFWGSFTDRFLGELQATLLAAVAAAPVRRGQTRTEVKDLHQTLPVFPSCTVPAVAEVAL